MFLHAQDIQKNVYMSCGCFVYNTNFKLSQYNKTDSYLDFSV